MSEEEMNELIASEARENAIELARITQRARNREPFLPVIVKAGCVGIESIRWVVDHEDVKVFRFDTYIKRVNILVTYGGWTTEAERHTATEVFLGVQEGEPEYREDQAPTVIYIPQGPYRRDSWWLSDYHWDKHGFYLTMFRSWEQGVEYKVINQVPVIEEFGR